MNIETQAISMIEARSLSRKSRKRELVYMRCILYNLLRNNTVMSLGEIGKLFNRDHTTVINGLKQYDILQNYQDFKDFEMEILTELIIGCEDYIESRIDVDLIKSEMEKCKDPVYFFTNYVGLITSSGVTIKPELSERQKKNLRLIFEYNEDTKTDTESKG